MKKFTIGEVGERLRISQHTLRYYEKIGIIEVERRGTSNIREYSEEDIHRLEYIKALKDIGFSLEEIKTYTVLKRDDNTTLRERRKILEEHRKKITDQINLLTEIRKDIDEKIVCIDRREEE